jgi:hypothetical protein
MGITKPELDDAVSIVRNRVAEHGIRPKARPSSARVKTLQTEVHRMNRRPLFVFMS